MKEIVLVLLLVGLVVFSGVQAVQINSLRSEIKEGKLGLSEVTSNAVRSQANPSPAIAQPSMVGGC